MPNVIRPGFSFENPEELNEMGVLRRLEKAGRTCYKSEGNIGVDSASDFIRRIMALGHESILEHEKVTVRIVCDRGVTHEIVRHRIASYSQESTRYCNYSGARFGGVITVIQPCFWEENTKMYDLWFAAMEHAESIYLQLLKDGASPQEARSVLPNALKTEIVVTYNLREWRHFLRLRCSKKAHPQMREIACAILSVFKEKLSVIFGDIPEE